MKANLSSKILMFVTLVTIAMVSCTKESSDSLFGGLPSGSPTSVSTSGSIVDNGVVNDNIRLMKVDVTIPSFTLSGSDGELQGSDSKISVSFYTDDDGLIPTGFYSFSTSDIKTAYTFDSGAILGSVGSGQTDQITGGVITVQQNGDQYQFVLQVQLASDLKFDGIYNGKMGYEDVTTKR
jgi:hypothetical protein